MVWRGFLRHTLASRTKRQCCWDHDNNLQTVSGTYVQEFSSGKKYASYRSGWWFLLNFTRSWGFGIFRVYWVSKSKCIISSNLRAEGSSGKVLNVVIFVESVVHRSNWRSRETETVGNSRKQLETVGNSRKQSETVGSGPAWSCQNCQSAIFLQKKTFRAIPFFLKVQRETVGNSWGAYLWPGKKRAI